MEPIAIIKSRRWKDQSNGNTCSAYGVLPYESKNWKMEDVGFTVWNDNGTCGNGRIPFKTLEEAKEKYPSLPYWNQESAI